jgi:glycosyltransferase involved in cell wall biosynthesis
LFNLIIFRAKIGVLSSLRIPTSPPLISAVAMGIERPLWSIMIPTYNCAVYLREALLSVLAQDMGAENMQIEVIDDASTDEDVEALVALIGGGRVQYFRQEENVGSLRNFETCLNRSHGHLIHLLHGDDRVTAGFYEKMTHVFQQYPEAGAVFSHYAFIDQAGRRTHTPSFKIEAGILKNWLVRIAEFQRIQYASITVRREVYEKVGGFYGTSYGEDWEMWVRIARFYPVAHIPEILAEYRGHVNSISAKKTRSGELISDLMQVMAYIQEHLPIEDRKRISKLSGRYHAHLSIGGVYEALQETDDWLLAQQQIKQLLKLSKHPSVYYHLLKFYIKCLVNIIK